MSLRGLPTDDISSILAVSLSLLTSGQQMYSDPVMSAMENRVDHGMYMVACHFDLTLIAVQMSLQHYAMVLRWFFVKIKFGDKK